jgi:hypothetical protein
MQANILPDTLEQVVTDQPTYFYACIYHVQVTYLWFPLNLVNFFSLGINMMEREYDRVAALFLFGMEPVPRLRWAPAAH